MSKATSAIDKVTKFKMYQITQVNIKGPSFPKRMEVKGSTVMAGVTTCLACFCKRAPQTQWHATTTLASHRYLSRSCVLTGLREVVSHPLRASPAVTDSGWRWSHCVVFIIRLSILWQEHLFSYGALCFHFVMKSFIY